jgi:alkylated DNA repair dioxygenase AlkB
MAKKVQIPPPEGFRYQAEMLSPDEEKELVEHIRELSLKEFEFHGFTGKRRVVYFGWRYDFAEQTLQPTEEMPAFLHKVRERAAAFANLAPSDLPHALVTEYSPGAAIGWHRDKGVFDQVVGVSLVSACNFRFRRKIGTTWERYSLMMEPRSIYLLSGAARTEWQHSIPGVDTLRYSITFRSLR